MNKAQEYQDRKALLDSIPHGSYGLTLNDLKIAYAQLSTEKPPTREGEMLRQRKLAAINRAGADYTKFNACETSRYLWQTRNNRHGARSFLQRNFPTDDMLRGQAVKERERIAQIDQELRKFQPKK